MKAKENNAMITVGSVDVAAGDADDGVETEREEEEEDGEGERAKSEEGEGGRPVRRRSETSSSILLEAMNSHVAPIIYI